MERRLKVVFSDKKLLAQAMTHRSFLNENLFYRSSSNERLEFLGDAIIEFVISEFLFKKLPEIDEGSLTNIRSCLVRTSTLAKISQKYSLGEALRLSKGEEESGGRENVSILADAFEALVGAIYLEKGIGLTRKFIIDKLEPEYEEIMKTQQFKDYKSLLQEFVQARERITPAYKVIKEEGPDHDKVFTVAVLKGESELAKAEGKSKQEAEQNAAKNALEALEKIKKTG